MSVHLYSVRLIGEKPLIHFLELRRQDFPSFAAGVSDLDLPVFFFAGRIEINEGVYFVFFHNFPVFVIYSKTRGFVQIAATGRGYSLNVKSKCPYYLIVRKAEAHFLPYVFRVSIIFIKKDSIIYQPF